ncbi:MAG TPA: hypothetical protein VJI98_06435 [Candidatus Nanoarchaeia archaeon]|nr:hypothetical protein [Candidatus Nanoarchaeia archaeon]
MALTKGSAAGLTIGLIGILSSVANPNFDKDHIRNPSGIIRAYDSNSGFNSSGKLYTISTAAAGLMGACLAYNLFSGNLVARKRED